MPPPICAVSRRAAGTRRMPHDEWLSPSPRASRTLLEYGVRAKRGDLEPLISES